jgi:hypothetical protein
MQLKGFSFAHSLYTAFLVDGSLEATFNQRIQSLPAYHYFNIHGLAGENLWESCRIIPDVLWALEWCVRRARTCFTYIC